MQFDEMNGWNAESDAAALLSNLGIAEEYHYTLMGDLDGKLKVRVLLAQALFGNPDVLIMDEPTNDLDFETIGWLENFLANYENTVIVVSHDSVTFWTQCVRIFRILTSEKLTLIVVTYTFLDMKDSQIAGTINVHNKTKNLAEEKAKELQEFIQRFSANVAKQNKLLLVKKCWKS